MGNVLDAGAPGKEGMNYTEPDGMIVDIQNGVAMLKIPGCPGIAEPLAEIDTRRPSAVGDHVPAHMVVYEGNLAEYSRLWIQFIGNECPE
mgnify:CR=1 FL=1